MLQFIPKGVFGSAVALFLSACASDPAPIINPPKPELISQETEGNFCTTGTKRNLGGIAVMPNILQHAIGKCKHPKWRKEDVIVLYFGDDGEQAPREALEEELDNLIHPEDYLTPAEIAELDCLDGSNCKADEKLLNKGVLVHFATDSDVPFDENEVLMVERIARIAKSKHVGLTVMGHTDNTATDAHNIPLSQRRAEAVRKILNRHGIGDSSIAIGARASSKPVATNDTPEGRAMNRRTEVVKKQGEEGEHVDGH